MNLFKHKNPEDMRDSMILSLPFTDREEICSSRDFIYGPKLITSVLNRNHRAKTK